MASFNGSDSYDGGFTLRGRRTRPVSIFGRDIAVNKSEYTRQESVHELRNLLGEAGSQEAKETSITDKNNNIEVGSVESSDQLATKILTDEHIVQDWDVMMLSGSNISKATSLFQPGESEFDGCCEQEKNGETALNAVPQSADNEQCHTTHERFSPNFDCRSLCEFEGRCERKQESNGTHDIPVRKSNSLPFPDKRMDSRGYYNSQSVEERGVDVAKETRHSSERDVRSLTSLREEQAYNEQLALARQQQQQARIRQQLESHSTTDGEEEANRNSANGQLQTSSSSLSKYLRRSGDYFSSTEEVDEINEPNGYLHNHQPPTHQQQPIRPKSSPRISGVDFQRLSMSRSGSLTSRSSSIPGSIDSGVRMNSVHNSLVVVAIDFGTTFSGYAFAFTRDPDSIHMMRKWEGGDPGVTNQKTPTTLLLRPDGSFHSFGFGARDCYHDLEPGEAKKWLYFDKFKMSLHSSEELNANKLLKAANGKEYPATKVFSHALRFFKDHVLAELSDQSTAKILEDDITWVLTVPAIWRQPAKQFMRNASYDAGIASPDNPERLLIALEPEAASIFCRKLRIRDCILEEDVKQKTGDDSLISEDFQGAHQYIVVDCGGGTVDLTVHELDVESGTLKELHKGTGGACGATGIDQEFENLLKRMFDTEFIERFKTKRPAGWVDLMIAFEAKKRTARHTNNSALNISLPFSFIDYYKKHKRSTIENAVKKYKNPDIKWSSQGMLRLSPRIMQELFDPVLVKITTHIKNLLNKSSLKSVEHLFLVGGFAESPLLQNCIRRSFKDNVRVVIPHDVGLTILKGAVLFGLDPTVVRIRRSALTYGVGVLNKFDFGKHDPSKRVVKDGITWCKDIFDTFVTIDESVGLGDRVTRSYAPARSGQKSTVINVYCSEKEHVMYTTDSDVQRCGQLRIEMPEVLENDTPIERRGKPRELQASMIFGDTETKVTAMDMLTGKAAKATIDFLQY